MSSEVSDREQSQLPLLLYGILSREDAESLPVQALLATDDPLGLVRSGSLAAVVGRMARQAASAPTAAALVAYQSQIARVHRVADILPARFGCVVNSEAELQDRLTADTTRIHSGLRRIAGCVELGFRIERAAMVQSSAAAVGGQASGATYLHKRQQYYRTLQQNEAELLELGELLRSRMSQHCRESLLLPLRKLPGSMVLAVAFLVDRGAVAASSAALATAKAGCTAQVTRLGPWPPYSFTDEGMAAGMATGGNVAG